VAWNQGGWTGVSALGVGQAPWWRLVLQLVGLARKKG
jgi:hypothetical protein